MLTLPERVRFKKKPYLSLRSRLNARQVMTQAQVFFSEVRAELHRQKTTDHGLAFFRYNLFAPNGEMEIDFGYFTPRLLVARTPFRSAYMPAGNFVSVNWHGHYDRLREVHSMLRGWMEIMGCPPEQMPSADGQAFACSLNIFHRSMVHDPDPKNWVTEVAYALPQSAG
ncbi:hypothetical protein [Rhizobium sp. TRM95796]|uniref:hypothetical protein n=1 Tax=Rhizobium sp. TRM95796 TaxID=2979862 RepID=UPI0021E87FE8|nr:hypothetical protein [Rhizobium sp. TRM95796]MCV3764521.1 hypothetical protein [Rhizobium sp. TRM95796]